MPPQCRSAALTSKCNPNSVLKCNSTTFPTLRHTPVLRASCFSTPILHACRLLNYLTTCISICLPVYLTVWYAFLLPGLLTTDFSFSSFAWAFVSLCLSVFSYLLVFSSFSHRLSLWLCLFVCLVIYLLLCQFFVTLSAAWSFCFFITDCSNRRLWLFVSSSVRLTDWRSDGLPGAVCVLEICSWCRVARLSHCGRTLAHRSLLDSGLSICHWKTKNTAQGQSDR